MTILIDTREQKEIKFKGTCQRIKLDVGDYTTNKLHGKFHIERKSPQDLYGTVCNGKNHMRFRRMLQRAEDSKTIVCMFVECKKTKFVNLKWKGGSERNMKPHILEKIINTISSRYELEFVWCANRASMAKLLNARLVKEELKLKQKLNGKFTINTQSTKGVRVR